MASADAIDVRKACWDVQLSEEGRTPCSDDSLPPYEAEDRLPPAYSSQKRHPPSQYLCLCGILCPLLWAIGALVLWFPLRHVFPCLFSLRRQNVDDAVSRRVRRNEVQWASVCLTLTGVLLFIGTFVFVINYCA
ncbi:hypothetical protein IW261DRAFT_1509769 [Armillaria novae-zelandiae]|uniref:Uncharacterized protein n=1 Tax=Armillaria novae-zelandiae TaxID=153914 RepID=A0AA39UAX7_9AGAR|nr:hypothetical protein IW261DRAFT_1509769 [Armillaria novae-zelandiae]